MNEAAILQSVRDRLSVAIQGFQPPPFYSINGSLWIAASALQKAIRRGRKQTALRAAARLLQVAPDRLWRRLGCISFEDVGVGDFEVVSLTVAALTGKRFRQSLGGDWPVASYLIGRLAGATKTRATDDLLMSAETHPEFAEARSELATRSSENLIEVATGSAPIHIRARAAWFAAGTNRWRSAHLPSRPGNAKILFDAMGASEAEAETVAIARQGWRKLGEALCPFTAMLKPFAPADFSATTDDDLPPEVFIGDLPGWCLDQYSREGRRALQVFMEGGTLTARWVRAHIPVRERIPFLGGIVFRAEGGLLRSRLRWALGDELRRLNDIECAGSDCIDASDILAMTRADIPELNRVRAAVMGV